jgi:hypothetical protein
MRRTLLCPDRTAEEVDSVRVQGVALEANCKTRKERYIALLAS